ncbi:hypothetical protein Tco_0468275, partial [Tanacetum coccineum]
MQICPDYVLNGLFSFLALRWHLEENHVTWAHSEKKRTRLRLYTSYLEETVHTGRGDGVADFKRRRQDFQSDDVMDLMTVSGRSRLKVALEDSTWRRRHDYNTTPLRRFSYIYKTDFRIFHDKISQEDRGKLGQFAHFLFSSLTEEEGWNRIEEYIKYQDDLWDNLSLSMNISSITGPTRLMNATKTTQLNKYAYPRKTSMTTPLSLDSIRMTTSRHEDTTNRKEKEKEALSGALE